MFQTLYLAPEVIGGARRDRTADLLRARQALSHLSYGPNYLVQEGLHEEMLIKGTQFCAGQGAGSRSVRKHMSETATQIQRKIWWVWVDLNHRPHPYQGCALTN